MAKIDLYGWMPMSIGAALILLTIFDVIKTALTARGGGPVLMLLVKAMWKPAMAWHRRRSAHGLLAVIGNGTLIAGFIFWALLLWIGWTLVFSGDLLAVVHADSRRPAEWIERIYYVGFSMSTLGIGDFVAGSPLWQLLTIGAAMSGFFVLTLAVTYLVAILPALARKRALANYIGSLEASRGLHVSSLAPHVPTLLENIETSAQEHGAYPILHYLHTEDRGSAFSLRLAALFEALPERSPDESSEEALTASLHEAIEHFVTIGEEKPTTGSVRSRLRAQVQQDGWSWQDVAKN